MKRNETELGGIRLTEVLGEFGKIQYFYDIWLNYKSFTTYLDKRKIVEKR